MTARELAINILYKIEQGEGYSNITLDKELNKSNLSVVDKGLTSQIVYGVLTWKLTLDEIIKKYSSIRLKKISLWITNILRIGIYQIVFLDKIPQSAVVNEGVKLAKKYGHEFSARFVNAILRKIEKDEIEKLEEYLKNKKILEEEFISIMTSHPIWLVNELLQQYNKEFVIDLLNSNNEKSDITIRVNTLKSTKEELYKILELKGIEYELGKFPDSIKLKRLSDFSTQLYIVQDEAAQLACIKLEPSQGERVLDACSAPGGKATYLAQLMKNKGRVDAWDIHEHRVKLVHELAQKLGITIIRAEEKDATVEYKELYGEYDKILLDVPCTGLGVIRKKPDIKWSRKKEDIEQLTKVQEQILENCSKYIKPNGIIVYSTCTILKQENEEQIQKFLSKHYEFELIEEIKIYPHIDNMDGFYIAKLRRNV